MKYVKTVLVSVCFVAMMVGLSSVALAAPSGGYSLYSSSVPDDVRYYVSQTYGEAYQGVFDRYSVFAFLQSGTVFFRPTNDSKAVWLWAPVIYNGGLSGSNLTFFLNDLQVFLYENGVISCGGVDFEFQSCDFDLSLFEDCSQNSIYYVCYNSGHKYVETFRNDSTCIAPGSIVSTCSRCKDTETETLPALGHDYSVTARNDPTCAAPGSVTFTCSRCNDVKTEGLPPSYHSWDIAEMVPSVYNEDGSIVTEGYTFYTCSSCGSSYTAVAGTSPPAAGPVSDSIGGSGMSDTTAALGKTFLSGIWSLFGISVPGFGFTFGQMWLGVLLCSVSILVIRIIFGFGGGPRGDAPRTSSTSNPRISKERRRDEF